MSVMDPRDQQASFGTRWLLSLYFVALAIIFLAGLFVIWPGVDLFPRIAGLPSDVRLLLIALTSAGLGSVVNAATSFTDFVGNRALVRSWVLWYVFRPLNGLATGLVVYAAIRGGILKADSAVDVLNPYAVVAIAASAGFLSKQIIDKLNDYGSGLFRTSGSGDDARRDQLHYLFDHTRDALAVIGIEPNSGSIAGGTEVTIRGTGFSPGAQALFDEKPATSIVVDGDGRTITVMTPPQSVEMHVDLEVVNPDGEKATLQRGYQYTS